MIILLSPAKSLDFESEISPPTPTEPQFSARTQQLVSAASRLTKKRLKEIMPVSDNLIDLNYRRYRDFYDQPERSAIFAFNGDVYTGFEVTSLDPPALDYAQDHVRILSGLYGLLRPLDKMRPYRLEMGTRWAPRHSSLVKYWSTELSDHLVDEMAARGGDAGFAAILNLASQEYYAAVKPGLAKAGVRIIDVDFRSQGPDGPRFISFAAKRARGMMARYACEHRIDDVEALKGFDSDGYQFDASASDVNMWRFIRA